MVAATEENTKTKITTLKADAGYFSKDNIKYLENKKIDGYIPPQKNSSANNDFKYDQAKDEFVCNQGKRLFLKEWIEAQSNIGALNATAASSGRNVPR